MKKSTAIEKELFTDIDQLLSTRPMPLETGIRRLPNGMLQVSVRTDLHGCSGRMVNWWFTFFETTQHIKWWHPHDHVLHGGWDQYWKRNENYIGATIHATESLGSIPPVPATIRFHHPAEVFNPHLLEVAYARNEVSAAVYARIGFGKDTPLDADGDPLDGYMFHILRDTPWGCVLRSRFYLGAAATDPQHAVPDETGLQLMVHCYSEFSYLSRFLPSLYYAENKNGDSAPLPW
ncbi:hypothetical protein SAMN04488128_103828 [Chitinophaga eiseniae]|uniref:DAPG hydrolase PhiG domain-containing protein n=1 Tax=Chitinophaga eiseniae TaxID=634771 RepID=A0A1T4SYT6_9BACT|nr:hydrolase [Chitinophaga eiseniae]SKA33375.1 hypothetical protein SAMN04488128_103828 [Chitinophaga eiseniae]